MAHQFPQIFCSAAPPLFCSAAPPLFFSTSLRRLRSTPPRLSSSPPLRAALDPPQCRHSSSPPLRAAPLLSGCFFLLEHVHRGHSPVMPVAKILWNHRRLTNTVQPRLFSRKRLFSLINDLPTLVDVVTGRKPIKDNKPSSDSGSKSRNGTKVGTKVAAASHKNNMMVGTESPEPPSMVANGMAIDISYEENEPHCRTYMYRS